LIFADIVNEVSGNQTIPITYHIFKRLKGEKK